MNDRYDLSGAADCAHRVADLCREKGLWLATAESCTGGLIGSTLTDIAGSSAWYRGGVISYDNSVKRDCLGVSQAVLDNEGAVSEACVGAMARGVLNACSADIAVAVSGIAGPSGGSVAKPVGLVFIALADKNGAQAFRYVFSGDRMAVRMQTVCEALTKVAERVSSYMSHP